jgi:hypothetical protein
MPNQCLSLGISSNVFSAQCSCMFGNLLNIWLIIAQKPNNNVKVILDIKN